MKNFKGMKKATVSAAAIACMAGVLGAFAPATTVLAADETNTAMHYDVRDGGTWDGTNYYLTDGTMVKNAFFCDGTYTYYLQNDGTAMKDRLTYHPDGEHIIYFDASGHEVFSNFTNVKQSIAGEAVDDLCFFDTYGYMYVDFITYDQAGVNLYYANPYGVMERNGWFTFSDKQGGGLGYANPDGTLAVNQNVYDQNGNLVYLQGNGKVQGSENNAANSDAASTGTADSATIGVPMGISTGDQGETVYWARGSFNPDVAVCRGSLRGDTGLHGTIEFHDGYVTYGGYSYPIAGINATSANFHGIDASGSRAGNTWFKGVDFAGVFSAESYCLKRSIYEAGGYTMENAIEHFGNNGIYSDSYTTSAKFYPSLYYKNYKDTGLYDMYGCDGTYYVLDYLAYGYAEGKTEVLPPNE